VLNTKLYGRLLEDVKSTLAHWKRLITMLEKDLQEESAPPVNPPVSSADHFNEFQE
jgi:hypothetical protein